MKHIFQMMLLTIFLMPAFFLVSCAKESSLLPQAEIDKPAPDFTLTDTNGQTWVLSQLRGQVVMVNFWATWCQPCRQEIASLQALHRELTGKGFQMLSILVNDDPNQAVLLANAAGLTFPVLIDHESTAITTYGITGVPETFIVDASGILREKVIGPWEWDSPKAHEMIKKYIP